MISERLPYISLENLLPPDLERLVDTKTAYQAHIVGTLTETCGAPNIEAR